MTILPGSPRPSDGRAAEVCLLVALAWGAFAFGAVYPWAYWPLVGASILVALLTVRCSTTKPVVPTRLVLSLATVALAIGAQLVPLPLGTLASWSPETIRVLQELDLSVGFGSVRRHAISIDPAATGWGLALFSANAVLLIACARLFSTRGSRSVQETVEFSLQMPGNTALFAVRLRRGDPSDAEERTMSVIGHS